MTDGVPRLETFDVDELAARCREGNSSPRAQQKTSDPCHELFRRAIIDDNQRAWAALYDQYRALMLHAGRAERLDDLEQDSLINETFARFSQWVQSPKFLQPFPSMAILISTLKKCARTTSIDHYRRWEYQQRMEEEKLHAPRMSASPRDSMLDNLFDRERTAFLHSRLKDDEERLIFTLSWELGFTPREIASRYPDQFPDVQTVYRIKERIVRRLSKDPLVQRWDQ